MNSVTVETLDGIKKIDYTVKDNKVRFATVNLGIPIIRSNGMELPLTAAVKNYAREDLIESLTINEKKIKLIFLNIGVPHAVIFTNDINAVPVEKLGPVLEKHMRFPEKTNVEFVQVIDREHIIAKSWSRGVGAVMSNGTGAAAAATASYIMDYTDTALDVKLSGGTLQVEIADDNRIAISGPATVVYTGEINM